LQGYKVVGSGGLLQEVLGEVPVSSEDLAE
jgi:hypothetical protein